MDAIFKNRCRGRAGVVVTEISKGVPISLASSTLEKLASARNKPNPPTTREHRNQNQKWCVTIG